MILIIWIFNSWLFRHYQVECTLFFLFLFCLFMHVCYSLIPPFSWSSISPSISFFFVYMSVFFLSRCVLSSDYSAKPCLNSFLQNIRTSIHLPFITIEFVHRVQMFPFFFVDIPLCVIRLPLFMPHCFWKTKLSHIIFYLFVAFCFSLSFSFSFTNIFVSGMRVPCCLFRTLIFCMCWPCFSLSTSVCLFDFFFSFFFACSFFFPR